MPRAFILVTIASLTAPIAAQRVVEASEPNASTTSATVLPCGQEAFGSLSSIVDEDWFRVVLAGPTDLWIATGPSLSNQVGDTVVTLLDDTGGPLRANDDGFATGFYSEIYAKDLPAGTYYAAVTAGANAATSGGYLLDVRCEPVTNIITPLTTNEGPENNDPLTGGAATNVLLPVRCNGDIHTTGYDGDWDFWRVRAFGEQVMRIRLSGTANHSGAPADDLAVYVFDGATPPNLVAGPFFASDTATWDQAIDVRIAGGFHHVAVRGVEGSGAGSYYLDLSTRPSASATVFAGGCGGRSLTLASTNLPVGTPRVLERAVLGATYSVEGVNLGTTGFAFHVLGLAATSIDLTPFGAIGCTLEVSYLDTVFQFADAAGRATWSIFVPDSVNLLGTTVHSQAAVLDLSNPLGITISNRVAATIGN